MQTLSDLQQLLLNEPNVDVSTTHRRLDTGNIGRKQVTKGVGGRDEHGSSELREISVKF